MKEERESKRWMNERERERSEQQTNNKKQNNKHHKDEVDIESCSLFKLK